MNSIQYLINTLLGLYTMLLMLRMWLQYCRADFYHPLSQSVVKFTDPVLNPLRKILPTVARIDLSALVFVFLLGLIKLPLLAIFNGVWNFDAIVETLPQLVMIGLLSIPKVFGEMLLYILFIGAISSWFNRGGNNLSYFLHQLGEPVLNPVRRILPKTGIIDFSPMLVAFALMWLNKLMYDIFPTLWPLV